MGQFVHYNRHKNSAHATFETLLYPPLSFKAVSFRSLICIIRKIFVESTSYILTSAPYCSNFYGVI